MQKSTSKMIKLVIEEIKFNYLKWVEIIEKEDIKPGKTFVIKHIILERNLLVSFNTEDLMIKEVIFLGGPELGTFRLTSDDLVH